MDTESGHGYDARIVWRSG